MHILDDPTLSPRVRAFLDDRATRKLQTAPETIRAFVHAQDARGRAVEVPAAAVEAMLAFDARYGGLSYTIPGWPNEMEYGLDGETLVELTDEGWAFVGVLDGSLTAALQVLLDGRILAGIGPLPLRVVDASVEQRLERHALVAQLQRWPHRGLGFRLPSGTQPVLPELPLAAVEEATGPADLWWADAEHAVVLHQDRWSPSGDDWTLTCGGPTARAAQELLDSFSAAVPARCVSPRAGCAVCLRDLPGGRDCPGRKPRAPWRAALHRRLARRQVPRTGPA